MKILSIQNTVHRLDKVTEYVIKSILNHVFCIFTPTLSPGPPVENATLGGAQV